MTKDQIKKEVREEFESKFDKPLSDEAVNWLYNIPNKRQVYFDNSGIKKFIDQTIDLIWQEAEKGETTEVEIEGKDELYCYFWRCLSCKNGNNPEGSKYCNDCGRKIKIPHP